MTTLPSFIKFNESLTSEGINEGAFHRLPKKVINDTLYLASKDLTNFYDRSAAGNDVDPGVLKSIISNLQKVQKEIKQFKSVIDVGAEYGNYSSKMDEDNSSFWTVYEREEAEIGTHEYLGRTYTLYTDDEHNHYIKVNGRIIDVDESAGVDEASAFMAKDVIKTVDFLNRETGGKPGYLFFGEDTDIAQFDKLWASRKYQNALDMLAQDKEIEAQSFDDVKIFVKESASVYEKTKLNHELEYYLSSKFIDGNLHKKWFNDYEDLEDPAFFAIGNSHISFDPEYAKDTVKFTNAVKGEILNFNKENNTKFKLKGTSIEESLDVNEGYEKAAIQQALKANGYDLKQSDVKIGQKKKSGGYIQYTLNGEVIGSNDYGMAKLIDIATAKIKENPNKFSLGESSVNEAMVQVAGKSKPSGAKVLATIIVDKFVKEEWTKAGMDKGIKSAVVDEIAKLIMDSTF